MIYFWGLVSQNEATASFQPAADLTPSPVVMLTLDMVAISDGGMNLAIGEFLKFGDIQSVIEMAMRQEKTPDIGESLAVFGEGSLDPANSKKEASVDQVNTTFRNDEVVMNDEATELYDFGHRGRVSPFVKKPTMDAF
ncbi:MAG: hypothetical protein ACJAVK_000771 [Akkermansiaceae bacterium]|jgi:hypothetical protein